MARFIWNTVYNKKDPKAFYKSFGIFYWYLLILFLPALGADKAKGTSEKADHYPGNDGKAPAEALGDEGDTVGGEGASDIGAGIDNTRCRWNVFVFLKIRGDHTNEKVVNTVHASSKQRWEKNGKCNKSSRKEIDAYRRDSTYSKNDARAPHGICEMLWI